MASTVQLVEIGLDLVSLPGAATNSQIQQGINTLKPATGYGFVIYSESVPDVEAHPEYAYFLWLIPSTREVKYWNGSSWELCITQASIADGYITLAMLGALGASARQLIRRNVGGTAWEVIDPANIFNNSELSVAKLYSGKTTGGFVVMTEAGGLFGVYSLSDYLVSYLAANKVAMSQVKDAAGAGDTDMVAALTETSGVLQPKWADAILRDNSVLTKKLKLSGVAGLFLKANVAGTDLEGASALLFAAVVKYTGSAGVAAQAIVAGNDQTVQWNSKVDPNNAVSVDAATHVITLGTGTWEIEIMVPLFDATTSARKYLLQWYNVDSTTVEATATGRMDGDEDTGIIILKHVAVVTGAFTDYLVRISASEAGALGAPANLGAAETYQQLSLRKLA